MNATKHHPFLWPDHKIGKRESRRLREEHNELYNSHAELLHALEHVELGVFGSMLPGSDIEICTRAARLAVQSAISKAKGNA